MSTNFLTLEEVSFLHDRLIERFGGARGVRDSGCVDSALARPRFGYYDSLSEQAAALLQSLAHNHTFVDGIERITFAAYAVLLRLNGYRLAVDTETTERFLIDRVIEARADLEEIRRHLEAWMAADPAC